LLWGFFLLCLFYTQAFFIIEPHVSRRSLSLFFICVAIWSTTWLAIKFQLGIVAPEVSVGWRFGIAALTCAALCVSRGETLSFSMKVHLELIALGLLMFCVSYICVYVAEGYVVSGLVAVGYSAAPLLNMMVSRVAFNTAITARVAIGGALGLAGVVLVFLPEISHMQMGSKAAIGALFTAAAVSVSSIANVFATRASNLGLSVWQKMAWSMGYGAIACFAWALINGKSLALDISPTYLAALLYLALAGSVLTFAAYFAFMQKEGAARAGYIGVLTPIAALAISSSFEQYQWSTLALLGIALAVAGNLLMLKK
jgi:drug/metabolite transporter (DMT)-like permease